MKKAPQIHPEIQTFWSSYERLIAMGVLKDRQRDSPPTGVVLIDFTEVYLFSRQHGLPCATPHRLLARMRNYWYRPVQFGEWQKEPNGRRRYFHVVASRAPDWMHGFPEACPDGSDACVL